MAVSSSPRTSAGARARRPVPVIVTPPEGIEYPRIERRNSKLHGWGVFARQDIPKNKRIIAYTGEKVGSAESLKRERRYLKTGNIWCFKLNSRWVIDGHVGGNDARYINHSCTPNCYTQIVDGIIWVRAARNIRKGEELTYNYYTDGEGRIRCLCKPGCKTLI
jgi:SET domain-containing protein